uniref:Putative peptide n=1 Tax=Prochloron didemni P3-Solomon TaxID=910458 RepID=G0XS55_PRODI|nr:putative precursor peptide [Prochloron didemni P3-Solomon]
MATKFTPNLIQGWQTNLYVASTLTGQSEESNSANPDENLFFQILVFEDPDFDNISEEKPQLVYGKKKDLVKYYDIKEEENALPTYGVKVDESFTKLDSDLKDVQQAKHATVRFLLQTRRLSQMLALTWIDKKDEEYTNLSNSQREIAALVKRIFDSYNLLPETYLLKDLDQGPKKEDLSNINTHLNNKNPYIKETSTRGFTSISLSLLLAGQAYYGSKQHGYKPIFKSIFSTYEMIWEYALDITWDSFYASRVELTQAGGSNPKPPYYLVEIPYPPKPSEQNLPSEYIRKWATAKENPNTVRKIFPSTLMRKQKSGKTKNCSKFPLLTLICR